MGFGRARAVGRSAASRHASGAEPLGKVEIHGSPDHSLVCPVDTQPAFVRPAVGAVDLQKIPLPLDNLPIGPKVLEGAGRADARQKVSRPLVLGVGRTCLWTQAAVSTSSPRRSL